MHVVSGTSDVAFDLENLLSRSGSWLFRSLITSQSNCESDDQQEGELHCLMRHSLALHFAHHILLYHSFTRRNGCSISRARTWGWKARNLFECIGNLDPAFLRV